jgi:hypothetical protein
MSLEGHELLSKYTTICGGPQEAGLLGGEEWAARNEVLALIEARPQAKRAR